MWPEAFDAFSERNLRFQTSAVQFGRGPSDNCYWLVHLIDLLYNKGGLSVRSEAKPKKIRITFNTQLRTSKSAMISYYD